MPELPEVETVRRGLAPVMEGRRIVRLELRRKDLRFAFPENFSQQVSGRLIVGLGRRAKYLLIGLEDNLTVISHLGMSGSFRIETGVMSEQPGSFALPKSKLTAHDHAVFYLDGPEPPSVIYNDPRRFGFMDLVKTEELESHPYFLGLGPEPTGNALSADYLAARLKNSRQPVKSALLDQGVVAGLGNIYVCEALFRAGISPASLVGSLVSPTGKPTKQLVALEAEIRAVIAEAITAGGSSLRDHIQTDGSLGYFQHSFQVYGRQAKPCLKPGCAGEVARMTQSGRSTFYCPTCQT